MEPWLSESDLTTVWLMLGRVCGLCKNPSLLFSPDYSDGMDIGLGGNRDGSDGRSWKTRFLVLLFFPRWGRLRDIRFYPTTVVTTGARTV